MKKAIAGVPFYSPPPPHINAKPEKSTKAIGQELRSLLEKREMLSATRDLRALEPLQHQHLRGVPGSGLVWSMDSARRWFLGLIGRGFYIRRSGGG